MRKYACVKVFSFIFNYNYHNLTPNKNLQLKYMNQQNIVVEAIINRIISKSRKNSLQSIDCRTVSEKSEYSNESEPFDQEYIIKKSDLKSFVQKMALENYENNIAIEKKTEENQKLRNEVQKWKGQFEQLKKNTDNREQILKKKLEESEGKCLKQKKKREQMEMEVNWSTNKIKQQMREIEKLKHSTVKNTHRSESENQPISSASNKDKHQYVTPGKDSSKKLQNLGIKNCESIDYSMINSDVVKKFIADHYQPIKECNTEQSKEGKHQQNNKVLNSLENHSSNKRATHNGQNARFHRHAEIDQKERLLKLLGEKCLYLQSYIQKLTKKYLGEVVYTQQSEKEKYDDRMIIKQPITTNLKIIQQHSASSLQRSQSDVIMSSAFQVQPEL